jgi:hypothetical protein
MLCSENDSFVTCISYAYIIALFLYAIFCAVDGRSLGEFLCGFMFATVVLLPILVLFAFLLDRISNDNRGGEI